MSVLLDLVAFDTIDHSVLLDCLDDWVDVTRFALELLRQHGYSHLHPQRAAIVCPKVQFWVLFFFV